MEQILWKRNKNQPEWNADGEEMLGAYRRTTEGSEGVSGYSYVFHTASRRYRVYRFILSRGTQIALVDSLREAISLAKGGIDADWSTARI